MDVPASERALVANLDDGADPELRTHGSFDFSIVELRDGAFAVKKAWIAYQDAHEIGENARIIWRGSRRDLRWARTVAERAAVTRLTWDRDPNVTMYPGAETDIVRYVECARNHIYRPLTRRELSISLAARAARFDLYGPGDLDGLHSGRIPGEPVVDDRADPDLRAVGRLRFAIGELRDGTLALRQESTVSLDSHMLAHTDTIIWRGTADTVSSAHAAAQRVAVAPLRWNSERDMTPNPATDDEIVRYVEATNDITRQVTRRELRTALDARPILQQSEQAAIDPGAPRQPHRPERDPGAGLER